MKENKSLDIEKVVKFTDRLWNIAYHEERWLATDILIERRADLTMKHLPTIEHRVRTAIGWAQLDEIAAWLVGTLYELDSKKMEAVFRKWIQDESFWVRRAAILGQLILLREGSGNFTLFTQLAVPLLR